MNAINGKTMEQASRLNQEPVNQAAAQWLQKAGQATDPSSLHVLQLMLWGLTDGGLSSSDPPTEALVSQVLHLLNVYPEKAMQALFPEPDQILSQLQQAQDPAEAAAMLLEELD